MVTFLFKCNCFEQAKKNQYTINDIFFFTNPSNILCKKKCNQLQFNFWGFFGCFFMFKMIKSFTYTKTSKVLSYCGHAVSGIFRLSQYRSNFCFDLPVCYRIIQWNHQNSWWLNFRGIRGYPSSTNLHPQRSNLVNFLLNTLMKKEWYATLQVYSIYE